jgi:hypothetical protein
MESVEYCGKCKEYRVYGSEITTAFSTVYAKNAKTTTETTTEVVRNQNALHQSTICGFVFSVKCRIGLSSNFGS